MTSSGVLTFVLNNSSSKTHSSTNAVLFLLLLSSDTAVKKRFRSRLHPITLEQCYIRIRLMLECNNVVNSAV